MENLGGQTLLDTMLKHDHKYSVMKDEMKKAYREARLEEQNVKRKQA